MGYIWSPPREVVESANVTGFLDEHGFRDYKEFIEWSRGDGWREFWGRLPEWLEVEWFREPREVVDLSEGPEWAKWYRGGLINAAYNVLHRPVKRGLGGREALRWVGEDGSVVKWTYSDVLEWSSRFASYIRELGVKPGDVVAIYAPMAPESIAAMLGSVLAGAVAAPIFSGFAPPAVAERLRLSEAKVLVTVDGYYRRGRRILLKPSADEAVKLSGVEPRVLVVRRLGVDVPWVEDRDEWWHKALAGASPNAEPEEVDPEHPALLLFTSGTTGTPKGAVISHAGAILQPGKEHFFNLDIHPAWRGGEDRLWWITDLGWMMGPWQVFGAQLHGASHLVAEGAIDYPWPDRVWRIIEEHGVTHLGFAATVARMIRSVAGDSHREHDLSKLRAFGNTGEPIDPDTWLWIVRDVGEERRPMINLSGGTEIFGCFVLPSPVVPLKPSTLWGPGPGMDVDVWDDEGRPVRGRPGYLVARKPAPSMTRGLWRDPDRYIRTYWSRFPGVWYHGDLALIDEDGYWFILGRADDVIKVAGKRIGPAEIESVLNEHPAVAESACIGYPHPVKGEVIVCLYKPAPGASPSEELNRELAEMVAARLGKPFKPYAVLPAEDLPRTRSGKIMRRIIRALARGQEVQPSPVMENPEAIEAVRRALEALKEG